MEKGEVERSFEEKREEPPLRIWKNHDTMYGGNQK
jgi:hypothetical protein